MVERFIVFLLVVGVVRHFLTVYIIDDIVYNVKRLL